MANTTFAKTNALTQKIWSAKLLREALKDIYLSRLMGQSDNSVIQVKTDLTKKKGDKITIPLRMRMTGSGQSSQTSITLEGNEEALSFYDFSVELTEYGHAVRAGSKLDLQRPAFDLRNEMKNALKDWLSEKIELLILNALITSPTTGETIDKTGTGNMTAAYIQQAKRLAQLHTPKVRPVKIDGRETYVLLVHPYVAKAIKADTDFKNAQYYANIRGEKNPIFSGALGIYDGVIIHEYGRSELLYDTSNHYAYSLLLGAQAGVVAWGQYPSWYEKLFDYERIPGVATDFLVGVAKTVFNSKDFGVITIKTQYTPDS